MASEDAPATKKDLAELEDRLSKRIEGSKAEMLEQIERSKDEMLERMRDMQTELLRAFQPWQDQVRIQFRELEVNTGNSIQAVKERMNVLERRLLEIERKLLMNPPAA